MIQSLRILLKDTTKDTAILSLSIDKTRLTKTSAFGTLLCCLYSSDVTDTQWEKNKQSSVYWCCVTKTLRSKLVEQKWIQYNEVSEDNRQDTTLFTALIVCLINNFSLTFSVVLLDYFLFFTDNCHLLINVFSFFSNLKSHFFLYLLY